MRLTAGFADLPGARLYYEQSGEGHPLVLNHAGITDSRMWDDQVEEFARHYRVIRWDVRGYGGSSLPAGPFAAHEDLHGLLEHLGVESAHMVGLSMGGGIAIDFALRYPDRVVGLIPVASALSGYNTPPNPILSELREAVARGDAASAAELQAKRWVDGPHRAQGQVDARVREKVKEMCRGALGAWQNTLRTLDPPALGRLGEIRARTLVIEGDQDVPYIGDIASRLVSEIPNARKAVIAGVAHMVNMERPREFNRLVLDFLKGLGGPSRA